MIHAQFQWWFLLLPISCMVAIGTGIFHVFQIKRMQTPLHESVFALTSYLRESVLVFLKRQLLLIGVTVGLLALLSIGLQLLDLHRNSFMFLIIWGVAWSGVIGYFAIRKSTQITGDFLQQGLEDPKQWQDNVTRMGWALTLLPLGILTLLLWVWMSMFQILVYFNIGKTGENLMRMAGLSGAWSPELLKHPVVQQMHHAEMGIILLAFCFGPLIQAFLVRMTTQMMRHATGEACQRLAYFYPGAGSDDLRNPVSMAHHIGHYAYHVWGQLSGMVNTYLTVVLSAIAISVAALREDTLLHTYAHIPKLPFILACFGLLGAAVASMFPRASLSKHVGISGGILLFFALLGTYGKVIPPHLFGVMGSGILLAWGMFYLKGRMSGIPELNERSYFRGLVIVWIVISVILGWFWLVFTLSHGQTHVLVGISGIALAVMTFMAVTLPYLAFSHRHAFVHITMNNARILQVENTISDTLQTHVDAQRRYAPVHLMYQTTLMTWSGIVFFFVFFEMLPYWMQKVTHPTLQAHIAAVVPVSESLTFEHVVRMLGVTPTNGNFLLGLFLAFWVVLGLGAFWTSMVYLISSRLFQGADRQLQDPAILEGQALPSYVESVAMVTTRSYQSSFGLLLLLCLGTLGAGYVLGLGGLAGLFLGMLLCSGIAGIYAFYMSQWREHADSELAHGVIALAAQAIVLFAILFGVIVLYFGHGLS
jgi:hypothetical protein